MLVDCFFLMMLSGVDRELTMLLQAKPIFLCMQIRDSVDIADACRSYFSQLFPLNPGGIIPSGPTLEDLQLDTPHHRGASDLNTLFHKQATLAPVAT